MAMQSNSWSLALRYHAQAERHYRRAIEEFKRLKALRPELPNEPVLEAQPEPKEDTCPLSELNPFLPEAPLPSAFPASGSMTSCPKPFIMKGPPECGLGPPPVNHVRESV